MPQRLSRRAQALAGDPAHPRDARFIIPVLVLISLFFLPGILRAQARSSMQVAATVLSVEPSRAALSLAVAAMDPRNPTVKQSKLAQIRVEAVRPTEAERTRRVRIDFLRN